MGEFGADYIMSVAMKESGLITDMEIDDWNIISFPTSFGEFIVDTSVETEFHFTMGLAGGDMTAFTEDCYAILDNGRQSYLAFQVLGGCPAHILEYYDGFLLGLYAHYYSDDKYDTYDNNPTLYAGKNYFFVCPGDSMGCALLLSEGKTSVAPYNAPYAMFYVATAKVNTYRLEDDGDFVEYWHNYTYMFEKQYPNYGFSSTELGSCMNIDADGSGSGHYWFDYNSGNGYMHFHRFLAVHDERLDIGDTLTVWFAEFIDGAGRVMSTSLELASGVSLAASAAAVLASATLL